MKEISTHSKNEEWKPVGRTPERLYEISTFGRVRSCGYWLTQRDRIGKDFTYWKCGRMLTGSVDKKLGYVTVDFGNLGRYLVHILVLETFVGPCPEGMVCRHLDGNPANNRLENLSWGTPKENGEDMVKHGRSNKGSKSNTAKLAEEDIPIIRRRLNSGELPQDIARDYRVGRRTINAIRLGDCWTHVKGGEECFPTKRRK